VLGWSIAAAAQTTPPRIETKMVLTTPRVARGRTIRASLIVDIPAGYHVNGHEPVSRFALPTKIEVEVPNGFKVGPIKYPKAVVRKFNFSDERLAVYERRAVITFSVVVPANQSKGETAIKALLSYQSCSNEVCFPPVKRDVTALFTVL
jgi:DsbC/DsbD-like thiol-disulfide interchange protein